MNKTCSQCGQNVPELKFKQGDKVAVPSKGIKLGVVRYVNRYITVFDIETGQTFMCHSFELQIAHGSIRVYPNSGESNITY